MFDPVFRFLCIDHLESVICGSQAHISTLVSELCSKRDFFSYSFFNYSKALLTTTEYDKYGKSYNWLLEFAHL